MGNKLLYALASFAILGVLYFMGTSIAVGEDSSVSATLTVNSYVDTSITNNTLTFSTLNPGTTDNAATTNPIAILNTANSNVAIDIYLNNTNMTNGSNIIGFGNLSVWFTNAAGSATSFNVSNTFLNGTAANSGFVENLATSSTANLYFWQDVPAGQAAGAYTATVTIHSVANGESP